MKLRNCLIIAHFASECCSHPLFATEHFKSTTELFIAIISVHYANHLVRGTYLTGLSTAKLLQNTIIMDIQGSNTVFSEEHSEFFFPGVFNHIIVHIFQDYVRFWCLTRSNIKGTRKRSVF